jgi:Lrp/AsnC family leucine-responsive transcriptional regulator
MRPRQPLDPIDLEILKQLQGNARMSNVEIARVVGMAPSAVLGRIRRLEQRGLLEAYEARLNAKELGFGLLAFIFVREEKHGGVPDTVSALMEINEIQSIYHIAGEDCFLIKARVEDTEALAELVRHRICSIKGVTGTRSSIVLQTLKETSALPLSSGISPPPPRQPKPSRKKQRRKKR